jgi:hypothetical protein
MTPYKKKVGALIFLQHLSDSPSPHETFAANKTGNEGPYSSSLAAAKQPPAPG